MELIISVTQAIYEFVGETTEFAKWVMWIYTFQQILFMEFPTTLQIEPYAMHTKVLALEELK